MPTMTSHLRAAAEGAAKLVWEESAEVGVQSADAGGDVEAVGVPAWGAWLLGVAGVALLAAFAAFLCGDDGEEDDEEELNNGTGAPAWVAVCAQCNRKAEGDMDEDTQQFYCNDCWDEWEDDVEGDSMSRPRRMSAVGQAALSERTSNRDLNADVSGSESDVERAAPAAAEADENLTWGTCLECRGYKLGEVDEFDDRFFCLECWDMWELQEDQEMSQRTPGGNYLGRRKSKAALVKFQKAASSVRAAVKLRMLGQGGQLGTGPSVGSMAALAARVEAKQAAEADADADGVVSDGEQDDYVDECTQCGVTAMGSQDDQTGEFYCNTCWDQYEDEEDEDGAGTGDAADDSGADAADAGAGAGAGAADAAVVGVSDLALGFPCSVCGDVKPGQNELVGGRNQFVCHDCRPTLSGPPGPEVADNLEVAGRHGGASFSGSGSYTDSGDESTFSGQGQNEKSTARLV